MSSEEKENIFDEASKQVIEQISSEKEKSLDEKNKEIAMYISENPGSEFKKLKEAIEGPFAEKFMKIMNELPDRDFMRYYLKTLEYFKPKITRVEPPSDDPKEDNVINVKLMIKNKDGEIKELNLNKETDTYE